MNCQHYYSQEWGLDLQLAFPPSYEALNDYPLAISEPTHPAERHF